MVPILAELAAGRRRLSCLVTMVAAGFAWSATGQPPASEQPDTPAAQEPTEEAGGYVAPPMMATAKAVALFERRVAARPRDPVGRTMLGRLYLRLAEEEDDLPAYAKAEESFRAAVELAPGYDVAKTYLATALEARHRFAEALKLAEEVAAKRPSDSLALATVGDCQFQLGRYEDAAASVGRLETLIGSGPPVLVRKAQLAQIRGDMPAAVKLVEQAAQAVAVGGAADGRALAWYPMRLATLHFAAGDYETAAQEHRAALERVADYAPSLAGLAATFAARGDWAEAERLYRRAVEVHGEPPAVAALGDILAMQGKDGEAETLHDRAEAAMAEEALTAAAAHYREVALFLADHDREPARALELAEKDLEMRQDVFAYDTLAWTLYRNGRFDEAAAAMAKAMAEGTRDAGMYYHAGLIAAARGDDATARSRLSTALEISPGFAPLLAADARERLTRLSAGPAAGTGPTQDGD